MSTNSNIVEHLQVLELDNCPLITDIALDHLTACHNLRRVELYDCQLITKVGIRRLKVFSIILIGFLYYNELYFDLPLYSNIFLT